MSLTGEYRRQLAWRSWPTACTALPSLAGGTILDPGCGIGDQAAELASRGARIIGIDMNEELLLGLCGQDFDALRDDFLGCLARDDHRSVAKVVCCVATRREAAA